MPGPGIPLLRDAVSREVGADVRLDQVTTEDVVYDAFLAHRRVERVRGFALAGGARLPWSLIVKSTEGPHLAVPYLTDNAAREAAAYRSGLLDDLGPGVRAPRMRAAQVDGDGRTVLLLEDVRHAGTRPLDASSLLSAAAGLGAMAGRWQGRVPELPWLFRGWVDRHRQPEAMARGLALLGERHPAIAAGLGDRASALERLVAAQDRLAAVLGSLPQTLCHHDAVGSNVFVTPDGPVLIDWESVGPGPVGADLASLIFASVRRGDATAATAIPLLDDAVEAYCAGYGRTGRRPDVRIVRRGVDASVGLRWKLGADVAASLEAGTPIRRGSLPDEAPESAMGDLRMLVDMLLRCADDALGGMIGAS